MLHRVFGVVILLMIAVLLVVSAVALANNLSQGSSTNTSLQTFSSTGKVPGESERETQARFVAPEMAFDAESLEPSKRLLSGSLVISYPTTIMPLLFNSRTKEAIASCTSNTDCILKPQYANKRLTVDVLVASNNTSNYWEFTRTVPLKEVFSGLFGRVQIPLQIPLAGFPQLYPQDYYFFDMALSYEIPGVTRLINGVAPPKAFEDRYSFDTGSVGQSDKVTVTHFCDKSGCDLSTFKVTIRRSAVTQFYVYGVSIIPLIAVILFLHLLFFSPNAQNRRFEEFAEAILVTIVAILPLRIVIVPAEISGLTRVDIMLAIGLVLVVTVGFGRYATEILSNRRVGPGGGHHVDEGPRYGRDSLPEDTGVPG